ncbi:hypothetical protein SAMN05661086_00921 [Anaeromicropila populeti]|uniref:Uncharacterized protein n=1 Tax=Anaeromicropila populeti TaxID=37658 RepID=A0A1I6IMV5_9FIRM|nr:hypothetical protein SAMN05661086_00921 [Anaeromicropila populeti]
MSTLIFLNKFLILYLLTLFSICFILFSLNHIIGQIDTITSSHTSKVISKLAKKLAGSYGAITVALYKQLLKDYSATLKTYLKKLNSASRNSSKITVYTKYKLTDYGLSSGYKWVAQGKPTFSFS